MLFWNVECERVVNASEVHIWNIWKDAERWPKWDRELAFVHLDGEFKKGGTGKLQPKGGPVFSFILEEVIPNYSFTDVTRLPLTSLRFRHKIRKNKRGDTIISHKASAKGLLSPLLYFTLRRKLKKEMPKAMANLADLAENESRKQEKKSI